MRVLFIAGRELAYPRNDVLWRAFQRFCQVDVLAAAQKPSSLLRNSAKIAWQAAPRLRSHQYDLIFVGFYGHLLMLAAGWLARQPVLFDAFVSTYDTLGSDRQVISPRSPAGRLAFWLDQYACRLSRHILLDTPQHAAYFATTFNLPPDKFSALPVGCNEDLFFPRPAPQPGKKTLILYYTSYMPLHGVDQVVQAAHFLRAAPLHFRLVGGGPTYAQVRRMADDLRLENIEFVPYIPLQDLPGEVAAADICLGGHFGGSQKAGRVVPGKIYQVLAMGRPLIATRTPANLDLLAHGESAYLCNPQDAEGLAAAILSLQESPDLRMWLAQGGRARYLQTCSEAVITQRLQELVQTRLGAACVNPVMHGAPQG